jgi:hypothetical protein
LEIAPDNFNAWIYKAISIFWQTTIADNRYNEAINYLDRAELIEKDNPSIQETRNYLKKNQVQWFLHLGEQEIEHGWEIYKIYATQHDLTSVIVDAAFGNPEAKENSREHFVNAMEYFLLASNYDPTHYYVLHSIRNLARDTRWVGWSSTVKNEIRLLQKIEQRDKVINDLPNLRKQLQKTQAELVKLKKEKGFWAKRKSEKTINKINSLKQKIAKYERIANLDLKYS